MGILDIILILLVISWLGGFTLKIGGGLIHLLTCSLKKPENIEAVLTI